MFFPGSRYQTQTTYTTVLPDGRVVTAVQLPLPSNPPVIGYHKRVQSERPDLIANHYLGDATTTWRLCDANNAMTPEALNGRALVAVPNKES
jgi:hypothetical protein